MTLLSFVYLPQFRNNKKNPSKKILLHFPEENRMMSKKKERISYQIPFFIESELFYNFNSRTS